MDETPALKLKTKKHKAKLLSERPKKKLIEYRLLVDVELDEQIALPKADEAGGSDDEDGEDAGDDAARRDRDPAGAEVEAARVVDDADEGHRRRVGLQRLAHAHHHDVRDRALAGREPEALTQFEFGMPELADDLAGGQVAAESLVAG